MTNVLKFFSGKGGVATTGIFLLVVGLLVLTLYPLILCLLALIFGVITVVNGFALHDIFFVTYIAIGMLVMDMVIIGVSALVGLWRKVDCDEQKLKITKSTMYRIIGFNGWGIVVHVCLAFLYAGLPIIYLIIEIIINYTGSPYWTGLNPMVRKFAIALFVLLGINVLVSIGNMIIVTILGIGIELIIVFLRQMIKYDKTMQVRWNERIGSDVREPLKKKNTNKTIRRINTNVGPYL